MGTHYGTPLGLAGLLVLALASCAAPDSTGGRNSSPVAGFSLSPALGTAPQQVVVNASSSLDPDGSIVLYSWDFGDGTRTEGVTSAHTYTAAGTFTVTLTVTDNSGANGSSSQAMFVAPASGTEPGPSPQPQPEPGPGPGPNPEPVPGEAGTVHGTVSFPAGVAAVSYPELAGGSASAADFVPGEVIISYQSGSAPTLLHQDTAVRTLLAADNGAGVAVVAQPGLDREATLELAAHLAAQPGVDWAEPNYLNHLQAIPNDPGYLMQQWSMGLLNMPQVWDRTLGNGTVVGIVDSGILWTVQPHSFRHPDLDGSRMAAGYDFVSDPALSNDYDGRDFEPFDNGDNFPSSSFHGTLVAGIIAATSNNNQYMAGIDTTARLVNVRAFGAGGVGNSQDILEGMMWAAGLPVTGVPANPSPARVINLSSGSLRPCSQFEQDSINRVLAAGAVLIVAAGNHGQDASQSAPANCNGVIVVGAVGETGAIAAYSNRGNKVDVYAPGGDQNRSVISITYDEAVMGPTYKLESGTSMAAAHVTGVVSLLLGLDPGLTTEQVRAVLRNSVNTADLTTSQTNPGVLNALAAVNMVAAGNLPDPEPQPQPASGAMLVGAFQQGPGGWVLTGEQAGDRPFTTFEFEATAGTSILEAWSDENGNGLVDAGDYYGWHPAEVNVQAGVRSGPYRIDMQLVAATGAASLGGLNGQVLWAD